MNVIVDARRSATTRTKIVQNELLQTTVINSVICHLKARLSARNSQLVL